MFFKANFEKYSSEFNYLHSDLNILVCGPPAEFSSLFMSHEWEDGFWVWEQICTSTGHAYMIFCEKIFLSKLVLLSCV